MSSPHALNCYSTAIVQLIRNAETFLHIFLTDQLSKVSLLPLFYIVFHQRSVPPYQEFARQVYIVRN
jgi:hypothetical protein